MQTQHYKPLCKSVSLRLKFGLSEAFSLITPPPAIKKKLFCGFPKESYLPSDWG